MTHSQVVHNSIEVPKHDHMCRGWYPKIETIQVVDSMSPHIMYVLSNASHVQFP